MDNPFQLQTADLYMPENRGTVRRTVYIPSLVNRQLEAIAETDSRSTADVIREAFRFYLDSYKAQRFP
ncbi:MAG TPA: hypothetical protein V6C84_28495 [Coleofasciculaceae cyanobacterium]